MSETKKYLDGAGHDWAKAEAPSLDDFAVLAEAAFAALPEPFKKLTGEVRMQVEDFATEEILDQVGVEDPFDLTGLYQGVSLAERSVLDPVLQPSQIYLYRRPILDEWAERGDVSLGELITHVLVHEIGHHFGLTDAGIHAAEDEA
jgi:predicted Zn-dependent protease with MMP-like domain